MPSMRYVNIYLANGYASHPQGRPDYEAAILWFERCASASERSGDGGRASALCGGGRDETQGGPECGQSRGRGTMSRGEKNWGMNAQNDVKGECQ